MRFRCVHSRSVLLLIAMSASLWQPCALDAADAPRGSRIQFGIAGDSGASTNLNRLAAPDDNLSPYQPGLFDREPKLGGRGSMGGVMVPPGYSLQQPLTPAQAKRAKDLLEKRKNWGLMTREQLMREASGEDETISRLRGGKAPDEEDAERAGLTLTEKFLLNLHQEKADEKKQDPGKKADRRDENKLGGESDPLTESLKETQRELKKKLDSDPTQLLFGLATAEARSGLSPGDERGVAGFFSSRFVAPLPDQQDEQTRLQKTRIETWSKEVLGTSSDAAPDPIAEIFKPQAGASPLGVSPLANPLLTPETPASAANAVSLGNMPGSLSGSLSASLLPSAPGGSFGMVPALPNTPALMPQSLGLPGFTPDLPQIDNTPRAAPVAPTFTMPRRAF